MNLRLNEHLLAACLLLLFPLSLLAREGRIQVRSSSATQLEVSPGQIATFTFVLSNLSPLDEDVFEEVLLPLGWQKVAPPSGPFPIAGHGQQVRILAIHIGAGSRTGRHPIQYTVRSKRDPGITDLVSVSVVVRQTTSLEIHIEQQPSMLVAGDAGEVKVRVVNQGNCTNEIVLSERTTPTAPSHVIPATFSLTPGSSQLAEIKLESDDSIKRKTLQVIELFAAPSGETNHVAAESVAFELIPKVTEGEDPYLRLPGRVRLMASADSQTGASGQAEVSGEGALDNAGRRRIGFLFRGSDMQDRNIFGLREEYRINYSDDLTALQLGDGNYSLSPLTQQYGYGRGVQASVHRDDNAATVLYAARPWEHSGFNEFGTALEHRFTPALSLRANVLQTGGEHGFITNSFS
jgi:hypothetical protein